MRTDFDRVVAIACFGVACLVGLIGAFVGLTTHGFWFDELFTMTLVEPGSVPGGLLARIASDVHPPVYLVLLSLYSGIAGGGDAALRSLSVLAACGAIVVFVAATRQAFSLPARLFGAAMATGSLFWFFQAQNARSYALCLLVSAGILALCLTLLAARQRHDRRLVLGIMIGLMFVGSFLHFYVMYESLAALMVLALFRRQDRYLLAGTAVALLVAAVLYVKLVVTPFSQVNLDSNWYRNDPVWYLHVLDSCVRYTFGKSGLVALALCVTVLVFGRISAGQSWRDLSFDRPAILLIGVPIIVLGGAVVSSTLLSPNFFDRNFLVVSPFLWALCARLYDVATTAAPRMVRMALNIALAFLTLSMASIVTLRLPSEHTVPIFEPYRESAAWIRTLPSCRDSVLPVISTDRAAWYKPGYAELIYESGYGRYLQGFARPQLVFVADVRAHRLPTELTAELQRRAKGDGCPILAWSVHNIGAETMQTVKAELLRSIGHPIADAAVRTKGFRDGSVGFVLHVER